MPPASRFHGSTAGSLGTHRDSAAPVKRGEPLETIAIRLPPKPARLHRLHLGIMCWRKEHEPSLIRGRPARTGRSRQAFVLPLDFVLDLSTPRRRRVASR